MAEEMNNITEQLQKELAQRQKALEEAQAALECVLISFFTPFVTFISTIPACVMGGVCMALYGFIAVSGLKMVQKIDLDHNKNLFVISSILISGIGGLSLSFGKITITSVACALILGIIVNKLLSKEPENTEENQ